jgi:competence protein ComEC
MRAAGVDLYGSIKSARLVELSAVGEQSVARVVSLARRELGRRLDRAVAPVGDRRALLGAILLGERVTLRPEVRRTLRDAGLAHLIAISGLHVGLIAWLVVAVLERVPIPRRLVPLLVAILLAVFALLVGARPSVLRAAATGSLWLLARGRGRDVCPVNTLGLLAAGLLIFSPRLVIDPGFQLTYLATAGILVFSARLRATLPLLRPLSAAFAVSASAYALTAPAVAWHFGRLAPIGLLTNLVVVPLCGLMLLTGYAALLLDGLPIGGLAAMAATSTAGALLGVAELAVTLTGGAHPVGRPPLATVIGCLFALAWAGWGGSRSVALARSIRALILVLLAWIHLGARPPAPGRTELLLLDVGQGQSVAIRSRGRTMLVDAGGARRGTADPGEREVVPALLAWSGRRLEILVLSHEDIDHSGGASAVLRDLEVGELWVGPGYRQSSWMTRLVALARQRGVAIVLAARGTQGELGQLPIRVLSPDAEISTSAGANSRSLVVLVGAPPRRILIPGDIAGSTELELTANGRSLAAEVLVLSHHGSRTGSLATFLGRVRPRLGLVSCGYRNRFGHPHPETVARYADVGETLLRTDRRGAILLRLTADGWWRVGADAPSPRRRRRGGG